MWSHRKFWKIALTILSKWKCVKNVKCKVMGVTWGRCSASYSVNFIHIHVIPRSSHQRCSIKKLFLKIWQYFQQLYRKKRLQNKYFHVNFIEHIGWLLLNCTYKLDSFRFISYGLRSFDQITKFAIYLFCRRLLYSLFFYRIKWCYATMTCVIVYTVNHRRNYKRCSLYLFYKTLKDFSLKTCFYKMN